MSMTDSVANLLTCIRNANKAGLVSATIPYSGLKEEIVRVLKEEGYVKGYDVIGADARKSLVVTLKYTQRGERSIEGIVRISCPSRRVYVGHDEIRSVRGGLGVAVFSTPKGVMTGDAAKKAKVGGEWICTVW